MTSSQQAYDYCAMLISNADSYFAMKICDQAIDHYGRCFTELKMQKKELIDLRFDKWQELFQKPKINSKACGCNHNESCPSCLP